jgi:serine phosphatase RsbU (regulator of sigma subunit)
VKDGKVSATLVILSADMETQTLLLSRNSNCPVLVKNEYGIDCYDETVNPIGVHKYMKPLIQQLPLVSGMIMVSYTDGIQAAGRKRGNSMELAKLQQIITENGPEEVDFIAGSILEYALALDEYRAGDDMTVVALGVCERESPYKIQRISGSFPW